MTDKQIIIDNCDVSGCVRLQDDNISCDLGGECKGWENCYYKQLQREKQECQQAMDNYVQLDLQRVKEYNELVNLYKAKEQECEELTSQRDKFEFSNNILEHERNNYKQALEEIEHQVTELFLGVENKDRIYCEKILDIINSVKDKNVPHKAKDGE